MKQNAAGLATICILSTMVICTVSITTAIYFGQNEIAMNINPVDVTIVNEALTPEQQDDLDSLIVKVADENGVFVENQLSYNYLKTERLLKDGVFETRNSKTLTTLNLKGEEDVCLAMTKTLAIDGQHMGVISEISDIYNTKLRAYGLFGGFLFMGIFIAIIFLVATILIIYFKQVSEGFEDKERFDILQKVGMGDKEVRGTINRQILLVFFLPLIAAIVHIIAATKIIGNMLLLLHLGNTTLTLWCIIVTTIIFALIYVVVYRLTAKTYYKIVKLK